jgi:hypothetical protein
MVAVYNEEIADEKTAMKRIEYSEKENVENLFCIAPCNVQSFVRGTICATQLNMNCRVHEE